MIHQFLNRTDLSGKYLTQFLLSVDDTETGDVFEGMKETLHYLKETEERLVAEARGEGSKSDTNGSPCSRILQEDLSQWTGMATSLTRHDVKDRTSSKVCNKDSFRSSASRQRGSKTLSLTSSGERKKSSLSGSNSSLNSEKSSSQKSDLSSSKETLNQRRHVSVPVHNKVLVDGVTKQKVGSLDSSPKWSKIKDKFERPESQQDDHSSKATVPNISESSTSSGNKFPLHKTGLNICSQSQEAVSDKASKKVSSNNPSSYGNRQFGTNCNSISQRDSKTASTVPAGRVRSSLVQPSYLNNRSQRPLSASASLPNSRIKTSSIKLTSREKSSTLPTNSEKSGLNEDKHFLRSSQGKTNMDECATVFGFNRTSKNKLSSQDFRERTKLSQSIKSKANSNSDASGGNRPVSHIEELREKLMKREQLSKSQSSSAIKESPKSPLGSQLNERTKLITSKNHTKEGTQSTENLVSSSVSNSLRKTSYGNFSSGISFSHKGANNSETSHATQDSKTSMLPKPKGKWKSNSLCNLSSESANSFPGEKALKDKKASLPNGRTGRLSSDTNSSKVAELASRFNSLCETSLSNDYTSNPKLHRLMKSNTLSDVPNGQDNTKTNRVSPHGNFGFSRDKNVMYSRSHSVGNIFSKSASLQTFSPLKESNNSKKSLSLERTNGNSSVVDYAKVIKKNSQRNSGNTNPQLQNDKTVLQEKDDKAESKNFDVLATRRQLSEKLKINLKFPADHNKSIHHDTKLSTNNSSSNSSCSSPQSNSQMSDGGEQGNLVKQVVQSYEKTIASLSPSTLRKQTSHIQANDAGKTAQNGRNLDNKNSKPCGLHRSLSSSYSLEINRMNHCSSKGIDEKASFVKGSIAKDSSEKRNAPKTIVEKGSGGIARNSDKSSCELYANIPSANQNSLNGSSKLGSDASPIKKAPVPLPRKCWSSVSDKNDSFEESKANSEDGFDDSNAGDSFIIHKLQPNPSFLWCCNSFGVCGRGGSSFRLRPIFSAKPREENIYDAIQNCSSGQDASPEDVEDHIYMDPLQFQPRRDGVSGRLSRASSDNTQDGSCASDECWVDISDTEFENQKEYEVNQQKVRMRSLPRRGSRANSLRRSWRDSMRDLSCDKSLSNEISQPDEWKSGEYEDVLTWEIVGGPDNSSTESTDSGHDYEAIYEFVDNYSDGHQCASNGGISEKASKTGSICSDTSDTGISLDSSGTRSTSTESTSPYAQQNGHCSNGLVEPSCDSDANNANSAQAIHLQRNQFLTRSDVHLEISAKLDKIKPKKNVHSASELGMYVQADRTSKTSQLKKKTFIKYILRQKSAVTYPLQKNVTSPKKETATFYVPCTSEKLDVKDKSRPLSEPSSCISEYANGENTIEETVEFSEVKISEYQNATVIQRKPRTRKFSSFSSIKRPKTPPPLPPAVAASLMKEKSPKTSLSRTRSDGSTAVAHRRILAVDSSKRPQSGPAVIYSNGPVVFQDSGSGSDSGSVRTESNRDSSCSLFSKEELESILGRDFLSSDQSSNSYGFASHIYETAGGGGEDMAPLLNGCISDSPKARGSVASAMSGRSGDSYIHANDVEYIPNWSGGKKCHGFFQEDMIKDVWIEKQQKRSSITGSEHSYLFITEHLTSPFEEEPLYQFYQRDAQLRAIQSEWTPEDYDAVSGEKIYERLYANILEVQEDSNSDENHVISSKLSAMELVRSDSMGHRTLWCEVPEVINSGILDVLTPEERRLQEALFEVITSEASYLKSLKILQEHFMQCPQFTNKYSTDCVLDQREHHIIFSDVIPVKSVSEKLMADLDKRWKANIVLSDLCDILYQHAIKNFSVYVKYCSQQVYKDRILQELRETRPEFVEVVRRLEMSPVCQGLDMHSFLMLPMQRITRYPLLVDAIRNRLPEESPQYESCRKTLSALNKVVAECNEGARKMHRMEEMLLISRQLDFKDLKSLPLISENRWLVKRGEMIRLLSENSTKRTFGRLSKPSRVSVYLLLFTDILLVTKKKSENSYQVLDYCQRNMIELIPVEDCADIHGFKNLFQMTMLQNHEGKTVEMILSCPLESDKTRWMEALMPPHPENPGEKVYSSWDFPRVLCIQPYQAQQPDELSLDELDIVNVFRKMSDGWYEGERVRDLARGWFPASHTMEIIDDHVKSRNFKQRHAFLKIVGEQTKTSTQQ